MHATKPLREVNRSKLPFAGFSVVRASSEVRALFIRLSGTTEDASYRAVGMPRPRWRTPGRQDPGLITRNHFAGGHRIRVTPVPIPNTEVKPDTADGTACESAWESRSLPALFTKKAHRVHTLWALFICGAAPASAVCRLRRHAPHAPLSVVAEIEAGIPSCQVLSNPHLALGVDGAH